MNQKKMERLKEFLVARGAEILIPTNEYEVLRFRANDKVSVLYKGRRGLTFTGEVTTALDAFENNKSWTGGNRTAGHMQRRSVKARTVRQRDGDACFYCGEAVSFDEESIEHLLATAHGGTNHISNLVLAHKTCNLDAGHMPIIDKVKKRESILGKKTTLTM